MTRKNVLLVAVAVCLFGGAAFFAWHAWSEGQDSLGPYHTYWVCADCKHEFAKPSDEATGNSRIACSKCGGYNSVRGLRCPNCQRIFVRQGIGQPICPHCNKPLPPPTATGG